MFEKKNKDFSSISYVFYLRLYVLQKVCTSSTSVMLFSLPAWYCRHTQIVFISSCFLIFVLPLWLSRVHS